MIRQEYDCHAYARTVRSGCDRTTMKKPNDLVYLPEHKSLSMVGAFPSFPTPLEQEQYQQRRTTFVLCN